jgi:hypothetical protein
MELTAYLAGERHSDHPACACPVLAAFVRRVNDASAWPSDAARTAALEPVSRALIGSADPAKRQSRALALTDWGLRVCRLAQARARGWDEIAATIGGLAPIVNRKSALAARDALRDARAAAYADARADARAAACAAAYAAAYADDAADADAAADAAAYAADAASYLTQGAALVLAILAEAP